MKSFEMTTSKLFDRIDDTGTGVDFTFGVVVVGVVVVVVVVVPFPRRCCILFLYNLCVRLLNKTTKKIKVFLKDLVTL